MIVLKTIQLFGEENMEFREVESVLKKTAINSLVVVFKNHKAIDAYELPASKHLDIKDAGLPEKRISELRLDFEVGVVISIKSNFLVFDSNNKIRGYTYRNSDHDKFVPLKEGIETPSDLIAYILHMQNIHAEHIGGPAYA